MDQVVHLWSLDCEAFAITELQNQKLVYESTPFLSQALVKSRVLSGGEPHSSDSKEPGQLSLITKGALSTSQDQREFFLSQAPMIGLGRVIALEHPELRCKRVDLDPELSLNEGTFVESAEHLFQELSQPEEDQVAFRNKARLFRS